jgi:hypothetical protein
MRRYSRGRENGGDDEAHSLSDPPRARVAKLSTPLERRACSKYHGIRRLFGASRRFGRHT